MMRDHGGNLDAARARHGGGDWIDLSTGINRVPWPVPPLPTRAWTDLPTRADMARLAGAAAAAWSASGTTVPLSGAQQAIQLIPRLLLPGLAPSGGGAHQPDRKTAPAPEARVLSPTYNEHAASLEAAGWRVRAVQEPGDLAGVDLAVVVNPNNPDGRALPPRQLVALLPRVGALVVDESFVDPTPELSLAAESHRPGLWVLRSFGKFYGLAGLRLGFALAAPEAAASLAGLAGPWPVSGAAVEIGTQALADRAWRQETAARLAEDVVRMDALSRWPLVGGTALFRLYDTPDAAMAQEALARHRIWSRIFPWSPRLIRLGLPGPADWDRVAEALRAAR